MDLLYEIKHYRLSTPSWWGGRNHKIFTIGVFVVLSSLDNAIVAVFPPLFGLSPAVALAYALTVHAFYLVVTSVLGLIGLALERESLTSVYGEIRTRIRPSQKVERPGTEEKPQHKDP